MPKRIQDDLDRKSLQHTEKHGKDLLAQGVTSEDVPASGVAQPAATPGMAAKKVENLMEELDKKVLLFTDYNGKHDAGETWKNSSPIDRAGIAASALGVAGGKLIKEAKKGNISMEEFKSLFGKVAKSAVHVGEELAKQQLEHDPQMAAILKTLDFIAKMHEQAQKAKSPEELQTEKYFEAVAEMEEHRLKTEAEQKEQDAKRTQEEESKKEGLNGEIINDLEHMCEGVDKLSANLIRGVGTFGRIMGESAKAASAGDLGRLSSPEVPDARVPGQGQGIGV